MSLIRSSAGRTVCLQDNIESFKLQMHRSLLVSVWELTAVIGSSCGLQRVRRTKVKFSRMLLFGIRQSRLYRLQLVRASSAVRNSVISDNEGTYAILPVCMCGDS